MDYTEIIYLATKNNKEDEIGNNIPSSFSLNKAYAKKQSVKTSEFYNAVQAGLNPTIELVVKRLNYNNEDTLKYNEEMYSIIRTIDSKNKFDIVLICQKKSGV